MTTSFTSRQLATNYEILVARTEFLVALATRKAQFRTLRKQQQRRRLQKRHLKSEFALPHTLIIALILSRLIFHMWANFF